MEEQSIVELMAALKYTELMCEKLDTMPMPSEEYEGEYETLQYWKNIRVILENRIEDKVQEIAGLK